MNDSRRPAGESSEMPMSVCPARRPAAGGFTRRIGCTERCNVSPCRFTSSSPSRRGTACRR
jgi:hypothetical protein